MVLDPRIAGFAYDKFSSAGNQVSDSRRVTTLTPAETQVAKLVAKRMDNRSIATELVLAEGTVKTISLRCYGR